MKRMTALLLSCLLLFLLAGCGGVSQAELKEMETNPYVPIETDTTQVETTEPPPIKAHLMVGGDIMSHIPQMKDAYVASTGESDYNHMFTAAAKQLKKAEYVVKRTRTYFKDAPKLPEPSSFVDVYQSGSSKSTVNGKVSKNVVQFKASSGEDITALLKTYIRKIKKEGFKVQHSGDTYTISSGKKKLATVKISKGTMEFDLK